MLSPEGGSEACERCLNMNQILGVDLASMLPDLPVSYLTIAVAAFVLIGLLIGFCRGFGAELLFLIKFVLMFGGALVAMYIVTPMVGDAVGDLGVQLGLEDEMMNAIVNVAVYCVALIALWIVTSVIWYFLKRIFLRHKIHGASRFFGMVMGVVKGAVFGLFFTWVIVALGGTFQEVQFFVDNASVDPVGQFLVDQNLVGKLADMIQDLF